MIDGIIDAWKLDGSGGALDFRETVEDEVARRDAPLWMHLDRSAPGIESFLTDRLGLEPIIVKALLAPDTRPRCDVYRNGLLVNLRGVNLNPGANPEDMLSLRIWATEGLVVSLRRARLMSVDDIRRRIHEGEGPCNVAELITDLALALTERMSPVLMGLHDNLDELEENASQETGENSRTRLSGVRHQIITLRRFIAPQQTALSHLSTNNAGWFPDTQRVRSREALDTVTRHVEDLDSLRDKAGIIRDEIANTISEHLNSNMYMLAIISMIFLPLSFVTGLLGINVGGMPGVESDIAFAVVCGILVILGIAEVALLKRLRWF